MLTRMRRGEDGYVLVVVLLSLILVLSLITGVMSYAVGARDLSARDQDWNASLAAAEAGIDDYVFRLNQDGSYWQYSDLVPPPDGNQAFTTWVPVPGEASDSSFRYDVDTSQLAADGTIRILSTGRVGNVTRTVEASLRRRNFLDYLYFTDFETKDPAAYGSGDDYTPSTAQTRCAKYYYAGRDIDNRTDFPGDSDGPVCTEITFISQDTVNGPLHSNDALRINGSPQFNGETTTSYDPGTGDRWVSTPAQSPNPDTPSVANPGDPSYADPLTMPPSNIEIKAETNAGEGGCLFTGPTAIRFNSNGTMDVISPLTRQVNCTGAATPDANLYYSGGNGFTLTNMALPSNGVIYVQNVPSGSSDPNYTNGCPFNSWSTDREAIGGSGSGNPDRPHPLGFPQRFDITPYSAGALSYGYGCLNGDVFLQGQLNGRVTIAADNNIILFGSTTYAGTDDLLGLVANNYVQVYHPAVDDVTSSNSSYCDGTYNDTCNLELPGTSSSSTTPSLFSGTSPGTSTMATVTGDNALRNPDFHAAIVTVDHSFTVQNYQYGDDAPLDELTVVGAIAQRYRGPVGTFSGTTTISGYEKDYNYDQRLKYDSPPHFLNPVASAWQVVTWAERSAAYPADAA